MSGEAVRLARRVSGFGVLAAITLGVAVPAAGADPAPVVIEAPTAAQAPLGVTSPVPGASVSGFPAGVRLTLFVDNGTLTLPADATGLTVPTGYAELGASAATLAVEGDEQALNDALSTLSWTPSTTGSAVIGVDAAPTGVTFDPATGHHYEVVDGGQGTSWTAARNAAGARVLNGSQGYMATITSPEEQALVTKLGTAPVWLGGRRGSDGSSWTWLTGPEDGTTFWTTSCGIGFQGSCPGAGFARWAPDQPVGSTEADALQLDGASGLWQATPRSSVNVPAYVVEYGDPDEQPTITAATTTMTVVAPAVPTTPEAPTGLLAVPGDGSVTVGWTAPAYEGASPVTGYTVAAHTDPQAEQPGPTCPVAPPARICTVKGLTNGVTYTFDVVATNAAGDSLPSNRSNLATPQFATTVKLTGVPGTVTEGATLDLVATVETVAPGAAVPTGSVTFREHGAELRTVPLDQGTAHLTISDLAVGSLTFDVSYPGGLAFAPAPDDSRSVTVTAPAPPTTPPTTQPVTTPPSTVPVSTAPSTTVPETTTTVAPETTTTMAGTAAASSDSTPAADAAPVTPKLTLVFDVGVGVKTEGARVTVRGQALRPGSVATVSVHSDPVLLQMIVVPKSGAFEEDVLLPHLEDGEHRLVASATTDEGESIARQYPFAVADGTLSRIGTAYTVSVPGGDDPAVPADPSEGAVAPTFATPVGSSGHLPVLKILLVLVALGGLGFLLWRLRQRRAAGEASTKPEAKPADRPMTASGSMVVRGAGSETAVGSYRSY